MARARRDVAELADIMLAMAQHDRIEAAFRRLGRVPACSKRASPSTSTDRAQPVGAFGVSRRRQMVETGGMRQNRASCEDPGALRCAGAREPLI